MDISLTTTEAVRAVLGISADSHELDDQVFEDHEIEAELEFSLDLWLADSASTNITTIVTSGTNKAKTALGLITKYLAALLILPSLSSATAKTISDGQDEFTRQDRDFAQLKADLQAKLALYQKALLTEILPTAAPVTTFSVIGKSVPTYDPITG